MPNLRKEAILDEITDLVRDFHRKQTELLDEAIGCSINLALAKNIEYRILLEEYQDRVWELEKELHLLEGE